MGYPEAEGAVNITAGCDEELADHLRLIKRQGKGSLNEISVFSWNIYDDMTGVLIHTTSQP